MTERKKYNDNKKICAISLVFSMLLSTCAMAAGDVNNDTDPYALGVTETVYIDGVNTTFYYYYTSNGERAIDISYENSSNIDTIISDNSNTVYLVDGLLRGGANTDWELIGGPESTYISWAAGTASAMAAAAIAAAIGVQVSVVVAVMGAAALATLVASCTGGTITYSMYERRVNWVPIQKVEWTFTANTGDTYGPYSYTISPRAYTTQT